MHPLISGEGEELVPVAGTRKRGCRRSARLCHQNSQQTGASATVEWQATLLLPFNPLLSSNSFHRALPVGLFALLGRWSFKRESYFRSAARWAFWLSVIQSGVKKCTITPWWNGMFMRDLTGGSWQVLWLCVKEKIKFPDTSVGHLFKFEQCKTSRITSAGWHCTSLYSSHILVYVGSPASTFCSILFCICSPQIWMHWEGG